MKVLSENTPITLGVVILVMGAVVSLTSISSQVGNNTKAIDELKAQQSVINSIHDDLAAIHTDIAVIKVKMEEKARTR